MGFVDLDDVCCKEVRGAIAEQSRPAARPLVGDISMEMKLGVNETASQIMDAYAYDHIGYSKREDHEASVKATHSACSSQAVSEGGNLDRRSSSSRRDDIYLASQRP